MPRRGANPSAKKANKGPPPSHPAETSREHRKFLIRSLERNDIDMNALIELNKSLHKSKEKILESCGELVLLDLGSGSLKLIDDELHEESKGADGETTWVKSGASDAETASKRTLTPSQIETCVDFLLRIKLRRKLSTRLIRRLTRLAHIMDGKDAYPPSAPKYGDLRLKIDPESLKSWQDESKKLEDAKKRIEDAIKSESLESEAKNEEVSGEKKEAEGGKEKEKKIDSPDETQSGDAPEGELKDETPATGAEEEEEKPAEGDKESGEKEKVETEQPATPALLDAFKLLKEYDTTYEKTWDAATNSFKYSIANEEIPEPEYEQLRRGAGIGATSMFLSDEQLEAEHKRWQTHLLRKIQEQPTFEELGLKNRVFHLGERRKRCLEEVATEGESEDAPESPTKKAKTEGDDDAIGDGEKETKKESGGDADDNSDSDDDEEMEGEKPNLEEIKPKRSISFAATPSFHDQDLARIRLIHRDLLNSSQAELTQKRHIAASNEYNQSLQLSTNLFNARQIVQQNLTITMAKGRQELTKAHNDYTIAYSAAKRIWFKEKFQVEMKKVQQLCPSKWGKQPLGTEYIKNYRQHNRTNIQRLTVGLTLADIVDGSILAAQGKAPIQRFKDFVPPPAPGMNAQTGENMAQRQHRMETELRKNYTAIDAKFQKSEADRARAWRKAMKATAEINAFTGNTGRGVRITLANYNQIPIPAIRGAQQSIPIQQYTQPVRASYTPTSSAVGSSTTDMSKYSAAKVKQRKSADGTVAPVSQPKKTKDGLYLRPAGRTRKGMQWDAVNGVWVPERS
eukprot:CAMPEP_0116134862 /NCGR_PEP_ID=MMETSP0329-20121206/10878_1 /TAXON_ID=697910 /ORGANISM="Pseudo-nitzschia arenysensis, Strain B593" /LENGTH=797 /DNA_ID=CAMNT_0003629613 /DNA_START=103 /DNA_END=2496 /DNA_ORIENTATION=+